MADRSVTNSEYAAVNEANKHFSTSIQPIYKSPLEVKLMDFLSQMTDSTHEVTLTGHNGIKKEIKFASPAQKRHSSLLIIGMAEIIRTKACPFQNSILNEMRYIEMPPNFDTAAHFSDELTLDRLHDFTTLIGIHEYFFLLPSDIIIHGNFKIIDNDANDSVFYSTSFTNPAALQKKLKPNLSVAFTQGEIRYGLLCKSRTAAIQMVSYSVGRDDFILIVCGDSVPIEMCVLTHFLSAKCNIPFYYIGDSDFTTFGNLSRLNCLTDETKSLTSLRINPVEYYGLTQAYIQKQERHNGRPLTKEELTQFEEAVKNPILSSLPKFAEEVAIVNQLKNKAKSVQVANVFNLRYSMLPGIDKLLQQRTTTTVNTGEAFDAAFKKMSFYD